LQPFAGLLLGRARNRLQDAIYFLLDLMTRRARGFFLVVPRFRDAILYGALLGLVFPLLIMALPLVGITNLPDTTLFLMWPGWIMLRGIDTIESIPEKSAILMWSVVWNIPLYVIAFALLWSIAWVSRILYDDLTNR
jgi:hypothetical protein